MMFVGAAASAATFVVPTDRQMVHRADAIAVVSALAPHAQLTPGGAVETVTPMLVTNALKGALPDTIDVVEPGGALGDAITSVPGSPQFESGKQYLLFLAATGPQRWSVSELELGKFEFATDVRGRSVLVRSVEDALTFDPGMTRHIEPRRAAEGFLRFVRLEAEGGNGAEDYFIDVQPLRRATTSTTQITPLVAPYTATSYTSIVDPNTGFGSRWTAFPNAVTFFTGTTQEPGAPNGGITAAQTALNAWNNDCASDVNYVYGGTDSTHTNGLHGADGANTILFEQDLSAWGIQPFSCTSTSYSGTLGIGGVTATGGTHTLGGETFYTTTEADVMMNRGLANCTLVLSSGDFNSAVTHEVGHTLGFRHSDQDRNNSGACSATPGLECSSQAIMTAFVTQGLNATLQTWDQHAVEAVYPGGSCTNPPPPPAPQTYSSRTFSGDFNGDGKSDILLQDSSGAVGIWLMNGFTVISGGEVASPGTQWQVIGAGDFNGDGRSDIFLQNVSNGDVAVWLMNAFTITSAAVVSSPGVAWHALTAGDVNGDGKADIILENINGSVAVWVMNGLTIASGGLVAATDPSWHVVTAADFNGDGRADILLQNTGTGAVAIWLLNGISITSAAQVANPGLSWRAVAAGDVNGDGRADVLLQSTSGDVAIWEMSAFSIVAGTTIGSPGPSWSAAVMGDFNGDRRADLVLQNTSNGSIAEWQFSGLALAAGSQIGSPGLPWKVVGY